MASTDIELGPFDQPELLARAKRQVAEAVAGQQISPEEGVHLLAQIEGRQSEWTRIQAEMKREDRLGDHK